MQVNISDGETFNTIALDVDLRDCFDVSDPEYLTAFDALQNTGRYWVGGGAAPLVYITRCFRQR